MNVYSYDEETFEYIGICKAYKNPKGKNYLIPAYSTQLAPPERGDNEIQVFNINSNRWEIKPDYRNEIWYVKDTGLEYEDEKKIGEVPDEYTIKEKPEGFYKWDKENQDWFVDEEQKEEITQNEYETDLATLDPLMSHILRHEINGESEAKARAELKFKIAQAEIMEKYGKGSTVLITENGDCYHKDRECAGLANSTNVVEINLSDGLKNYSPCSMCCN